MYEAINRNIWKSRGLMLVFVLLVVAIGYVLGEATGAGLSGLVLALVIAVIMSFAGYYYSDRMVLSISRAREVAKAEYPYLYNTVEGLSLAAGIPTPKMYVIDDTAPNAFATGRDPSHSAIAVTTGLLEKMDRLELEGVLAHEISHIQNYDIRLASLAVVLVGVVALLSDWTMRTFWWGGGRRRNRGRQSSGSAVILLVGLVLAVLAPLIAQLMRLAISRKREFLADAGAAMLTRYPEGLANALEKLTADTEPLEVANKATAHLYIVNPLKEHGGWVNGLFSTHPPIEARVRALRSM